MDQKQYDAINMIILGHSDNDVGEIIGVSRQTVNGWKNHDSEFIAELNLRRQEIWDNYLDKMRQMVRRAIDIIENDLKSDDEKARNKAAYFIAKQLNFGNYLEPTGETNPKLIGTRLMIADLY